MMAQRKKTKTLQEEKQETRVYEAIASAWRVKSGSGAANDAAQRVNPHGRTQGVFSEIQRTTYGRAIHQSPCHECMHM